MTAMAGTWRPISRTFRGPERGDPNDEILIQMDRMETPLLIGLIGHKHMTSLLAYISGALWIDWVGVGPLPVSSSIVSPIVVP